MQGTFYCLQNSLYRNTSHKLFGIYAKKAKIQFLWYELYFCCRDDHLVVKVSHVIYFDEPLPDGYREGGQ